LKEIEMGVTGYKIIIAKQLKMQIVKHQTTGNCHIFQQVNYLPCTPVLVDEKHPQLI
jgi:DhnA family fructose-bisphosphate aldolase class Ia